MKAKLTIFTNHYYPENFRINALSQKFSNDFDVVVVSQVPNYPVGDFYDGYSNFKNIKDQINDVKIRRLKVIPRKQSSIMLAVNYLSYIISTYLYGSFNTRKVDHVFVYSTSPIFLSWGALKLAKRNKVKSTLYLLDLWPQSMIMALNIKNKTIINILSKISLNIYKRFDKIVVSSESFIDDLNKRGIDINKLVHIPQHADEILDKPIKIDKIDDKVKIIFTGNIGEAQGLDLLVYASKILLEKQFYDFEITLVGDGRYKERLIKLVNDNDLNNYIKFISQVPFSEIKSLLSLNHFGYVSLLDVDPLNKTLPAKIQSYMAYGIPILASASGEIVNVVKKAGCGVVSKADDANDLANKIMEIRNIHYEELLNYSINGHKFSVKHYDIENISNKFVQLMKEGL